MADLACKKIRKDIGKTDETKSSCSNRLRIDLSYRKYSRRILEQLQTGKIGIGEITKFDHSEFAVHNAAEVQDFPFDKYFVKKDTNRFDNYSLYALYAAQEAVTHANLDVEAIDKDRFGCYRGSGIGGIKEIEDQVIRLHEKGPKRVKPMTLPKALPNMASGNVAMRSEQTVSVNQSIQPVPHQTMPLGMPSVLSSLVSKMSC